MEAYATIDDLQARWKALSDIEMPRAEVLLMDASVIVATMCANSGIEISDTDEMQQLTVKSVVCEMVKRAMLSPVDAPPVSQMSQTAGPFTGSMTYANPNGELYLKDSEKKRLGLGRQRLFSIMPGGLADEG